MNVKFMIFYSAVSAKWMVELYSQALKINANFSIKDQLENLQIDKTKIAQFAAILGKAYASFFLNYETFCTTHINYC